MGEGGCGIDECEAVPFPPFTECFAHLGARSRAAALRDLGPGSDVDLSRTALDRGLLTQILDALRDDEGRPTFGRAVFVGATFANRIDLSDVTFRDVAMFGYATFHRSVRFMTARFEDAATFFGTQFAADAHFDTADFQGLVSFDDARFAGLAHFGQARFAQDAEFVRTAFEDIVAFDAAHFDGPLSLDGLRIETEASFESARFAEAETLGPIYSQGPLSFDRAVFAGPAAIDAQAPELTFVGARFDSSVVLRLQDATVWLDAALFGNTVTVVGSDIRRPDASTSDPGTPDLLSTTSVGSLRGVDAGKLVLSGVDLSRCRFSGSYNLDKIRIEGRCKFADVPRGVRYQRGWPPAWWWTRRQTIIEEHRWRFRSGGKPDGWTAEYPDRPESTAGWRQPTHPERLSAVYRQLRKALEDAKNEPGAADFYYGEMDMRRLSPSTPRSERFVLTLYWLFSGYGLRASRALLGLVALVGITTWLLVNHGLAAPDANTEEALRSALNAVVFRSDDAALTTAGIYSEMVARIGGPILLALAALSVRNRVRR